MGRVEEEKDMTIRVIGAGFGRTGTTSLKFALEKLLGAPCYHMREALAYREHVPIWHHAVLGKMPNWDEFLTDGGDTIRDVQLYLSPEGDRLLDGFHNGERISTAFEESTVNQVVSRRMVKKQQMRWSHRGAHLLLQIHTRVLNGEWEDSFRRWYPGFQAHPQPVYA